PRHAYLTYDYSPVRDDAGRVFGVLATGQETTKRVLADRRLQILRNLAAQETQARSVLEACTRAAAVLAQNRADLPFSLLYFREAGAREFRLVGDSGLTSEDPARAPVLVPGDPTAIWPIERVLGRSGPVMIEDLAERVAGAGHRWSSGRVHQAMILPIRGDEDKPQVDEVLIAGLSARLPLDHEYRSFLVATAGQIGRGVASASAQASAGRAATLSAELSRLASLFEQAPGWLVVLRGPDHVFELTNPLHRQLIGHRDVVGKPAREALPELEGQGFFELLDRVYRTGEAYVGNEVLMQYQRTPGAELEDHYFNFIYQALRDSEGEISGIVAMGHDVTEQVHSREAVGRAAAERDIERRQLLTVLAQSPLGIMIAEAPSGRVLYANAKLADVTGRDLVPERTEDYSEHYHGFHPDGRPIASEEWPLARALQGEVVEHEIVVAEHSTGRRSDVAINAAPVRDAAGNIIAAVAFFRDVTVERRREQQLHDAQRLQSVGTLAGGVAHEINNQMTAVLHFAGFVLEELGPEHPQATDIRVVLQAANRATRVSQQLLAFTRRQVFQPREIALHELTIGLAPVLRQLLGSDKTLEIVPTRSTWSARADPNQIEQILINLVANARDATPTGHRVSIGVRDVTHPGATAAEHGYVIPPGDYVLLTVTDRGHGMDAGTLARIFEPFYTTKPVGEGTGLGLSMVYGIVKQHGGFIEADSTPGVGTVLRLYLPATADTPSQPRARGTERRGSGVRVQGRTRVVGQPAATVLVVEDDLAVQALTVRTLEMEGYAVFSAADGEAALDLVRKRSGIEAVITDVIMPQLNGRQLYDELARLRPEVPVLFVSGHTATATILQELLPPGASYLQKPFTTVELSDAVSALLKQRR
ncbi:MAG: PAS domain-containing protein, partial [Gemmatimonadota bacterium]|nr:PAS domain-containing protein [Gemmatimonadota bacterium]